MVSCACVRMQVWRDFHFRSLIYWTQRLDRLSAVGVLHKGRGENKPHIDVFVIRFLLRHLIERDAAAFVAYHDSHYIAQVGRPEMRFHRQERFGGVDCGQPLNLHTFAQIQWQYPNETFQWVPRRLQRTFQFILEELGFRAVSEITRENWEPLLCDFMRVVRGLSLRV